MERKNKILKIVSVVLLLCSFAIPMYNIFPNGLIVNQDSWFFTAISHAPARLSRQTAP